MKDFATMWRWIALAHWFNLHDAGRIYPTFLAAFAEAS